MLNELKNGKESEFTIFKDEQSGLYNYRRLDGTFLFPDVQRLAKAKRFQQLDGKDVVAWVKFAGDWHWTLINTNGKKACNFIPEDVIEDDYVYDGSVVYELNMYAGIPVLAGNDGIYYTVRLK